ncbi:MAG: uridine phosphorylase [Oscillospiraceae bacterium]|jgi:uridine phosphorylase|nr:uridine phosphorylase [Oscillospiraceae bacterium]
MVDEKVQYHVALKKGDIGRYALLPGDPGRCGPIAARFDNGRMIASHREYVTYTGTLDGEPVCVTSTGIGGASTAIAVEELVRCGVDTFIRVGTCGGMQPSVAVNDVVIAQAAIRFDGTSKEYIPVEFPAVADYGALRALDQASRLPGHNHNTHIGVVQCKDSFYGQHEPERMPARDMLLDKWRAWIQAGCLASEMESATLFILGSVLKVRTGAALVVAGNQVNRKGLPGAEFLGPEPAIQTAIDALRILIREDKNGRR